MKQTTNLFLLLFCLIGTQFMAQDPPPITGVSCSVGTPSSYVFTEDFEYSSTDEAIANGGWSGRLDQNNNNPLYQVTSTSLLLCSLRRESGIHTYFISSL